MIKREDYLTVLACRRKIDEISERVKVSNNAEEIEELTADMMELRELEKELAGIEQRKKTAEGIATGQIATRTIEQVVNIPAQQRTYDAGSVEYRSAWLKRMAGKLNDGNMMLGDLSEIEQRAFTMTTENTGAVVPTATLDRIIDLVHAETPILDDATMLNMEQGFAIPVRKSITAGDAAAVSEGTANDDENDDFDLIPMPGIDISKVAKMTRRMKFMSIDSFENWLVTDLAKRINVAKEKVLIARLTGNAPKVGVDVNSKVAIASENKFTEASFDDETIRKVMAELDAPGQTVVYANRKTIYNGFAGIENKSGQKLFVESTQVDPTIKGVMYGAVVKVDPNIPDNQAIFGVIGALDANDYGPIEIFPTVEQGTANRIFTGAVIFDGGLENPKAFAHVTFA